MAYATWDPSNKGSDIVLSDSDRTAGRASGTYTPNVRSTLSVSTGKYYWEITAGPISYIGNGVCNSSFNISGATEIGNDGSGNAGRWQDGGSWYFQNGTAAAPTFAQGDVLQFALDVDNRKLWLGVNGTWYNSGDPAAGTGQSVSSDKLPTGDLYLAAFVYSASNTLTLNAGQAAFAYSVPSGFAEGVSDSVTHYGEMSDGVGLGDEILCSSSSEVISSAAALSDQIDAYNLTETIVESVAMADAVARLPELYRAIDDAVGVSDLMARSKETSTSIQDSAAITESFEVLSWSEFVAESGQYATIRYYFTLTGVADGVADVVIPISSFQYRRRNDEPSYLSVVVPSMSYIADVMARTNGDMRLELAYVKDGSEVLREIIMEVDYETLRWDEGSVSQSITIEGHRTEEWVGGQIFTPTGVSYRAYYSDEYHIRCRPDAYVRPGDVVDVGDGAYCTADMISCSSDASYQVMEISGEAFT